MRDRGGEPGRPDLSQAGPSWLSLGSEEEASMDGTTLVIILFVVLIVAGGGWYGRGRWF
jgi:hypothetical protein